MIACARPRYFYKYTSSRSCKLILKSGKVKVSSPKILNDPFDNTTALQYDFEHGDVARLLIDRITELADSGAEISFQVQTPWSQLIFDMIHARRRGVEFDATLQSLREVRYSAFAETIALEQEPWQEESRNDRLFCFSHQKDSPLLWAHYADEFRGCVLEFENVPFSDSPFEAAKPVIYSVKRPSLGDFNEFFDNLTGMRITDPRDWVEQYSNTKFIDWEYENEWRFTLRAREPEKDFDLREFNPSILTAIYIGPRMTKRRATEITNLAVPYRNCVLYRMKPNAKDYRIDYERV